MRVVVAHCYYDSSLPSGENTAVADELILLSGAGFDVIPLSYSSDGLKASNSRRIAAVRSVLMASVTDFVAYLESVRPDVVHLHNTIPHPGPGLANAAKKLKIPVVQTVHNRRLAPCLAGTQFLNGAECTKCAGQRLPWQGVVHACYRGKRGQSAVVAASFGFHPQGWKGGDHYFAVSAGIASMLLEQVGIPPSRVSVKANPIPDSGVSSLPDRTSFLFAGRLDEAKGLKLLLESWRNLPPLNRPRLVVCGAGPLAGAVARAAQQDSSIEFLGQTDPAAVLQEIAASSVVLVPSIGGEGLPRILAEAFAAGRPVLCTPFDPMASVVAHSAAGWISPAPASADSFGATLRAVSASPREVISEKADAARRHYDSNFHPDAVLQHQLQTYERLVSQAAA